MLALKKIGNAAAAVLLVLASSRAASAFFRWTSGIISGAMHLPAAKS